jgi:hypothetical protein
MLFSKYISTAYLHSINYLSVTMDKQSVLCEKETGVLNVNLD